MLDSLSCEPYGYIKYDNDDLNNIIINEVEDNKIYNNDNIDFID